MNSFDKIINSILTTFAVLPDKRSGENVQYSMQDIGLTAFAVFFMQSPSFLSAQEDLQKRTGKNNLKSLFKVDRIPSDNHVRALLDPVKPDVLFPIFDCVYKALKKQGFLKSLCGVGKTQFIALDGTQTFSSGALHCDNCSTKQHQNGTVSYHHNAITPVIVAPHHNLAIPLRIEFLSPQDGHDKQDSEPAAAKRWLKKNGEFYNTGNVTLLGDDLYSRQPLCRKALLNNYHFIFVCKPTSHKHLYEWIDLLQEDKGICQETTRLKNKKGKWETHTLRYANYVPLIEADGALHVNWIEHIVTYQGEQTYKLEDEQKKELKGKRTILLRNEEDLDEDALGELEKLRSKFIDLGTASIMKECLRNIYRLAMDSIVARKAFELWCDKANASGVFCLKQMAKTITKRIEGILGYWKHGSLTRTSQREYAYPSGC